MNIIYHQRNVAAFKGNHVFYGLPFLTSRISVNSAAAADELIAQSRSAFRFVFSRVHGRVN